MVASVIGRRVVNEKPQTISISFQGAEYQDANTQYAELYYILESLRNLCGTTSGNTAYYTMTSLNLYADGQATHGVRQRMFGSVTWGRDGLSDITYTFDEFAPYSISGGSSSYDAGTKINNFVRQQNIYINQSGDANWTFKSASFVVRSDVPTTNE